MEAVDQTAVAELGITEGNHGLMLPPPNRPPKAGLPVRPRAKPLVLEEDEWALQLEAIIERDFFPDVPKLQSKLEWLQALRTRDPAALRQAQANIVQRRAGICTPIGATPGSFETPGASMLRAPHRGPPQTPSMTPLMGRYGDKVHGTAQQDVQSSGHNEGLLEDVTPAMTLDRFLAKHTSEDNASFEELLADMNARRWAKAPWLLMDKTQKSAEDDEATDEQGHHRALQWAFEPRNRIFWDGSQQTALQLSPAEHAQRVAGPPKAITHRNTRFVVPTQGQGESGASTPTTDGGGGSTPASGQPAGGGGWSVVATPSMTPGADGESPFLTWGDIAGTPVRLDATDTPENIGGDREDGPRFSMPGVPHRDTVTRRMAASASFSLKRKAAAHAGTPLARQAAAAATAAAIGRRTPGPGTPGWDTPVRRHGRSSPAVRSGSRTPISQAGQRLASSLRAAGLVTGASSSDADKQLRASYGHTPSRANRGTPRNEAATHAISSKEAARLSNLRQAALDAKQRRVEGKPEAGLTDDLLNL